MRTIGLIGGMSWESSAEYYRLINEAVKGRLGGLHSARSLMLTVDFAEVEAMQQGRWEEAGILLADAARRLERAGADCLVLCTNTMHKVAGAITASDVPLFDTTRLHALAAVEFALGEVATAPVDADQER